jgi:hypothetical protein
MTGFGWLLCQGMAGLATFNSLQIKNNSMSGKALVIKTS